MSESSRPALFLDRDGTLIADPGYLADPLQVELLPGVATALREMSKAGYLSVVITNQSGIGRGRYPASAYHTTQRALEHQLSESSARLDASYHCPHAPDAGCLCRKPGTALYREAIAALDIDVERSWCIGDRITDVAPCRELGCRGALIAGEVGPQTVEAEALGVPIIAGLPALVAGLPRYY